MNRTALRRWAPLVLAALVALVAVAGSAAAHAGGTFPTSGSEVQTTLQELYDLVGWMSIATSVIVGGLLLYVAVRFYDPDARGKGDWFLHNTKLEVTWTVGTLLVLAYLGVVTAQTMYDIETAPLEEGEEAIEVAALGQQWQWQFIYPDGNTTTDDLHIQANETFQVYSVSCDVIHSFYVPNLGVKIDTTVLAPEECEALRERGEIPTRADVNRFWIEAHEGTYTMSCAEFCGAAHADMKGDVVAFEEGARDRTKPYGAPPEKGEEFHVEITGSASDPAIDPSTIELNTGTLTTWYVHNNASGSRTLAVGAPYDVSTGPIPAGDSGQVQFTAGTQGSPDITVEGVPVGTLDVSSGEVVHVEMSDSPWYIRDGNQFEPGESYAIKVWNNGSIGHNLYIGEYTADRDSREPIFTTETYGADEFRWLNVTMPDRNATLDWWCDVPGHAEAGMLDEITVGAGGDGAQGATERDLIPAAGILGTLAAAGAATWVGRRRR